MKHKYFYILFFTCFLLFSVPAEAQSNTASEIKTETGIEGLSIYPNPASADKIYIVSKQNLSKKVEIYNVLGKKVHAATISGTEMNISFLTSGVYMLKIEEAGNTSTRKLMVK